MAQFPNPDTQFKPGQSGNPSGRPKKSLLTRLIEDRLNDPEVALALADQIVANIMAGDASMLKQAWDRTDGPVKESVELSGSLDGLTAEQRAEKQAAILASIKAKAANRKASE